MKHKANDLEQQLFRVRCRMLLLRHTITALRLRCAFIDARLALFRAWLALMRLDAPAAPVKPQCRMLALFGPLPENRNR